MRCEQMTMRTDIQKCILALKWHLLKFRSALEVVQHSNQCFNVVIEDHAAVLVTFHYYKLQNSAE